MNAARRRPPRRGLCNAATHSLSWIFDRRPGSASVCLVSSGVLLRVGREAFGLWRASLAAFVCRSAQPVGDESTALVSTDASEK